MSRKIRFILAMVVAIAFIGYQAWRKHQPPAATAVASAQTAHDETAPQRKLGQLNFKPCTLPGAAGRDGLPAQCTTLSVPENRAQADGRRIDLRIAWIPVSEDGDAHDDPVFLIAGGPGQSAVDSYAMLAPVFQGVLNQRDVILVDQRGTGGSNKLACDAADEGASARDTTAMLRLATTCIDALSKRADLRQYGTTEAVADLDAVRSAIGAKQINLYGVSYGTRVAQQYAMRHPQQTRSIVLDSVVPNSLHLSNIFARNLDDALALQFGVCTKDAQCKAKFGDPRSELGSVLDTLRKAPPQVGYRDPLSGEQKTEALSADEVAGLVRMFAYMPAIASILPLQIHEAAQGRYAGLKALTSMLHTQMKDQMAMGMQLSVVCGEDADQAPAAVQDDSGTVLGNDMGRFMTQACTQWPKGKVPADFHNALTTPVPALVLEGQFDPVTPPRYGEEVAKSLPNGRLLVLNGQGHNVIGAGCMPRLFAKFIETADAKSLDARCLDVLSPTPSFIDYNGWTP
ncbi:MAG: alpha/beta fold hydrolase [Xanthomonadales bacterium]|nr:alpha/beta fold hydrolase [Xanthomonadales bacterium]